MPARFAIIVFSGLGGTFMRRSLELLSLAALAFLAGATVAAFSGSVPLPARIPIHFNAAGTPDGWGSARMLWLLPAVSTALYLLMTWVSRYPEAFNYPVRVTPRNQEQLQQLALGMIAWLKAELLCVFAWIQWSVIRASRQPSQRLSPLLMPLLLAVVFATLGVYVAAMFRAGRKPSPS